MANEANIRSGLNIQKFSASGSGIVVLDERYGRTFRVDVDNSFGPSPGAINVDAEGTNVSWAEFVARGLTPDICVISNLEVNNDDNYIVVGRYDSATSRFYPFMRVYPGEEYVIRLSPDVDTEFVGTSTLADTPTSTLRLYSFSASCPARVDAYAS